MQANLKAIGTVGLIGTGIMGGPIGGHLLAAGLPLRVYNRTPSKAEGLVREGAAFCPTPAEVVKGCGVVLTMLGYPDDVEAVFSGSEGFGEVLEPGSIWVDMTTSSPVLARKLAKLCGEKKVEALDAPVTGGQKGAIEGTLSMMVGGGEDALQKILPLLQLFCSRVVHQGVAGQGQMAKLVNQLVIAGTLSGVCEGLSFARKAGLDTGKVMESISGGAAGSWTLDVLGPKMLAGDWEPGFLVKHFIKDLQLAMEAGASVGAESPSAVEVLRRYEAGQIPGEEGTQALMKTFLKGD